MKERTGGKGSTLHLTSALDYASKGWRVFPIFEPTEMGICSCGEPKCGSPAKHPRIQGGFNRATIETSTIENWWTCWPNANIGIATGPISGIWVLDLDKKPNAITLEDLEQEFGVLSDRPSVTTGSGGLHVYFRCTNIVVASRIGVAPGVDVRGTGGYVVAPPSFHINMNKYRWRSQ